VDEAAKRLIHDNWQAKDPNGVSRDYNHS
jgi:hypothetical protein